MGGGERTWGIYIPDWGKEFGKNAERGGTRGKIYS